MVSMQRSPIEVVAHRGSGTAFTQPDAAPENSLPAIEAAWQAGVDACEIDVHLTADGHVVVIHDETTGRTADRDLSVRDTSLTELQRLDAGSWKGQQWSGTRIATLEEVLKTIPAEKRLLIELKTGPEIVVPVRRVLETAGTNPDQLVLMSFDFETTAQSKRQLPEVQHLFLVFFELNPLSSQWCGEWRTTDPSTGLGSDFRQQPVDLLNIAGRVRSAGLDGINVGQEQPDDLSVIMANESIDWSVWTVDDPQIALAMAVKGASSITTNRPAHIADQLHQHGFATAPRGG
jgi:glycerophosphoryl diester phosphodiesterase